MKTCLFCKEQVQDDALKCRYCQSNLAPPQGAEPRQGEADRVTYVLDQGLVRFGKFAAGVLAIFLVVGGYLFGFKLEAGLEKVQATQEKSTKIQEQFTQAQKDLEVARQNVSALSKEVEAAASKTKTDVTVIAEYRQRAQTLVGPTGGNTPIPASFGQEQATRLMELKLLTVFRKVLTSDQFSALQQTISSPPELRRAIYSANSTSSLPGKLVRLEGQPATADASVSQVYDSIGTADEFFRAVFNRNLNYDVGGPLVATVHYSSHFNNMLWDGQQLIIGDGDGKTFAVDKLGSLGAVTSQLGHLVVASVAQLPFQGESG